MSKKIILCVLGLIPLILKAQLNVSTQLPFSGLVQKDQLWNITLVNNGGDMDVFVKLNLQDIKTGEVVLSANSGSFPIGKGVKDLRSRDVQPIIYNFTGPDLSSNYLPIGSYTACYQIYQNIGENPSLVAEECTQINIDPLSPPILNSPLDKSVLPDPYPQFTWMPPTPFEMFSNLTYELRVAEVLDGQSPREAVEYNTPVYIKSNILQTNDVYPSTFEKLDTGRLYAWQVIAQNGTNYTAKTDIWTFSIMTDEKQKVVPDNGAYILLLPEAGGVYNVHKEELHIKYYSFENEHMAPFVFTDQQGNIISQVNMKLVPGDNNLDFSLSNSFQSANVYTVTVTGNNNKNYFLRFTIK